MSRYTIKEIRDLFIPERYSTEEFNEKLHVLRYDTQISLRKKLDTKRYYKKSATLLSSSNSTSYTQNRSHNNEFNIRVCLNKLSPKTIHSIISSLPSFTYNHLNNQEMFKQLQTSIVNMSLLYNEIFKFQTQLDNYIDNFTNGFYAYALTFIKDTTYVKSSVAEQSLERTIRWIENTVDYISKMYWCNFYENYTTDICDIINLFLKDTTTNDVYGLKMLKVIFDNIGKIIDKALPADFITIIFNELKKREKTSCIRDKVMISEITKHFN